MSFFRKLEDVVLGVSGESIRRIRAQRYIERYQAVLAATSKDSRKNAA